MLTKGRVCEAIAGILNRNGGLSIDNLIHQILSYQNLHIDPIAPINIHNNKLVSDFIVRCLSDMIFLKSIQNNDLIYLTEKGALIYEKLDVDSLELFNYGSNFNKDFKYKIGSNEFNIHYQPNNDVYNFCRLLPVLPEIGALFCYDISKKMFDGCLPLYHNNNKTMLSYLLLKDIDVDVNAPEIKKRIKNIKSHMYNFLHNDYNNEKFNKIMILLFYYLLPISTTYLNYKCSKKHDSNILFENYTNCFFSPLETICIKKDCMSKIELIKYKLINDSIYTAWEKGILMEWYASKILERVTNSISYYNVDINNIQCDAISYDGNQVYLVECKRTSGYNTSYNEGILQLSELKKIFENKGLSTYTIMFTTIRNEPRIEKNIDMIITQKNFVDFSKNPQLR